MFLEAAACLLGALLLLVLPLRLLMAAVLAAVVHEFCHFVAARIQGLQVEGLVIGAGGAVMDVSAMTPHQELICALAGPAGSLVLSLLYSVFPCTALCGLIQGLFNLMPVYPLDGGRILRCVALLLVGEEGAERLCLLTERGILLLLLLGGGWLSFGLSLGMGPVFLAIVVILRSLQRKRPCKPSEVGVQ